MPRYKAGIAHIILVCIPDATDVGWNMLLFLISIFTKILLATKSLTFSTGLRSPITPIYYKNQLPIFSFPALKAFFTFSISIPFFNKSPTAFLLLILFILRSLFK